jgi:FixJ family two-component response regulator
MAGLTPGEQAVMDRFDLGLAESDIAHELDISLARTRAIISTFDDNPAHDRHRNSRVRRGSRRLLERLQAAGAHR